MVETCNRPSCNFSDLDFRPEFYRAHFEYLLNQGCEEGKVQEVISGIARRELTSSFLERYLKIKLYHYRFSLDGQKVNAPGYEPLGDVCQRFEAAIARRRLEGKPANREEAEFVGFLKIKDRLLVTREPQAFLLISPPPPSCELADYPGYDQYSFYFFGRWDPKDGQVEMFAWRNEKSLDDQIREANQLLAGAFSGSCFHPNDFLRRPIFVGSNFEEFRKVIVDMPDDRQFEEAKRANYGKYRNGIDGLARRLAALIASGADDEILRAAQVQIEMEFTKWVVDGKIEVSKVDPCFLTVEYHPQFAKEVMTDLARFALVYKGQTERFACGSCGTSILSLYNFESGLASLGFWQNLMVESLGGYIACPNCGESVKSGSKNCQKCGLTKADYDSNMAANR